MLIQKKKLLLTPKKSPMYPFLKKSSKMLDGNITKKFMQLFSKELFSVREKNSKNASQALRIGKEAIKGEERKWQAYNDIDFCKIENNMRPIV